MKAWVRSLVQNLLQWILEEEVTEALRRTRYARRSAVDGPPGSRNGYGNPRRLALMSGTIEVRRPRIRGLARETIDQFFHQLRDPQKARIRWACCDM